MLNKNKLLKPAVKHRRKMLPTLSLTLVISLLLPLLVAVPAFALNYTVKSGDSFYKIGLRYKLPYQEIQKANNIKGSLIYPGQVLVIPVSEGSVPSPASPAEPDASLVPESSPEISNDELNLLARAVYAEARGESYEGQVAVAAVILNRVESASFPNSISDVIYQKNQFSCVRDGQISLKPNDSALAAATEALQGQDPSQGALFFWNPAKTGYHKYLNSLQYIRTIGNHSFAK